VDSRHFAIRKGSCVERAASSASLSNQRQIVFFGFMFVLLVLGQATELVSTAHGSRARDPIESPQRIELGSPTKG
jgi:hypothetical protein